MLPVDPWAANCAALRSHRFGDLAGIWPRRIARTPPARAAVGSWKTGIPGSAKCRPRRIWDGEVRGPRKAAALEDHPYPVRGRETQALRGKKTRLEIVGVTVVLEGGVRPVKSPMRLASYIKRTRGRFPAVTYDAPEANLPAKGCEQVAWRNKISRNRFEQKSRNRQENVTREEIEESELCGRTLPG